MDRYTRNEKRQSNRKRLLHTLFAIVILSIIFLILFRSSLLEIDDIQVIGNYRLLTEDIVHCSGIDEQENILLIKTNTAEKNIKNLSYIKDVEVKRKLLNTVVIQVVEREDVAFIENMSIFQIIDSNGYILRQVDLQDDKLPTISGISIDNIHIGDNVYERYEIDTFQDFIQEGIRLGLLNYMERIDLESVEDVKIVLNNNIQIDFGTLDNVQYKLRLLKKILDDIEEKEIICRRIIMNKGEHPIIITDD